MAKSMFMALCLLISLAYVMSAPVEDELAEQVNSEVDNVEAESTEPKKTTKRGIYAGYGGYGYGYGYHYPHYSYSYIPLYKSYGYYGHGYGHGYGYYPYYLGYHGYGHGHYW